MWCSLSSKNSDPPIDHFPSSFSTPRPHHPSFLHFFGPLSFSLSNRLRRARVMKTTLGIYVELIQTNKFKRQREWEKKRKRERESESESEGEHIHYALSCAEELARCVVGKFEILSSQSISHSPLPRLLALPNL